MPPRAAAVATAAGPSAVPRRVRRAPASPAHREIELPGDRLLTIRPMELDDAPGISRLYRALGAHDLYLRFFSTRPPPESFVADMVAKATSAGAGLVATIATAPPDSAEPGERDPEAALRDPAADGGREPADGTLVAEATFSPLPDGDAELGITVAAGARGWLGPYLLDVLLGAAAQRGVANLQAEVLVTNGRMLSMLRRRGCAVLDHDDRPAIVRVVVGTASSIPSWAPRATGRRVVVETPGGRWRGDAVLRAAGYRVMACSGPPDGWASCPPMEGRACPLAAGADLVIDAVPDPTGQRLASAHATTTSVRLAVIGPVGAAVPSGAPSLAAAPGDDQLVALVRSLVPADADGGSSR